MQYNFRTIAGAIYVVFALFSVIILLPGGMFAHIDTENSVENITIDFENVILNWRNSTHVESLTLEFDVTNPSTNFKLNLNKMNIQESFLDGKKIDAITTAGIFVDIDEVIPSRSSEIIHYSFPFIFNRPLDNDYFYEEKTNTSSQWKWFMYVEFVASLGTESILEIKGWLDYTGVTHTGTP